MVTNCTVLPSIQKFCICQFFDAVFIFQNTVLSEGQDADIKEDVRTKKLPVAQGATFYIKKHQTR